MARGPFVPVITQQEVVPLGDDERPPGVAILCWPAQVLRSTQVVMERLS